MKFISCKEDSYFLQFVLFTGDLAEKRISCSINMSNIQSRDDLQFIRGHNQRVENHFTSHAKQNENKNNYHKHLQFILEA